ncbi:hypothetical protein [Saccharomonospora cyanea]|nr:hypothetical protein [Saccharomonospora cyanea]
MSNDSARGGVPGVPGITPVVSGYSGVSAVEEPCHDDGLTTTTR